MLIGSSYGETEPRKVTYLEAGHNTQPLTLPKLYPLHSRIGSSKNPGYSVVKMATPNGTKRDNHKMSHHLRERIKTSQRSREGRTPCRQDEMRNPFDSGRMRRNCCKVFRKHERGVRA